MRYRIAGRLRPVVACHCETCRRTSGHFVAATACVRADLSFEAEDTLSWWSATPGHRRGFCSRCGSSLFWEQEGAPGISVFAGTLDPPTGLMLGAHIFVAEKSDYYDVTDGLPKAEGRDAGLLAQIGAHKIRTVKE